MPSTCQLVPALALALGAAGCFSSHGAEATPAPGCGPPRGEVCCRDERVVVSPSPACPFACPAGSVLVPRIACAGLPDAGVEPRPDGGERPDASVPSCPLARPDALCHTAVVPAGTPLALPVLFEGCACCPATECAVEVDERARILTLATSLCPDPCDCDRCAVPIARCEVPPLRAGDWQVSIRDSGPAFTLSVRDTVPGDIESVCTTFAAPHECAPPRRLALHPARPDAICVGAHPWLEQHRVRLELDCPDCRDLNGPCVVAYRERFTDDLPPGGELRVAPASAHRTECGPDCPPACFPRAQACLTPPLVPGHFYRVWYEDRPVLSFTAGDAETCARL
ncbi:MAG: hypothetical protein KF729_35755 [Sandaracinaceae bacterium]|nr:hypothetical protein [Sandaracinaceae bacterium]